MLALTALAASIYAGLALGGDLRERLVPYLVAHGVLCAVMLLAFRETRGGGRPVRTALLAGALLFRLVACWGEPALSDDVHRFVWDGRVQAHGIHPYAHAPQAPELEALRDESWTRINHPELPTIYPPVAQALFALLALLGAGPVGFKLALGLVDFGVVLALDRWLRGRGLPPGRLVLYAWNPLVVMETAGSGHVEPAGVLLLLLALGWSSGGRPLAAVVALAGAIHVKLVPVVALPAMLRGWRPRLVAAALAALALPVLPYALTGPPVGGGLFAYARHWQHNAALFGVLHGSLEWLGPTPWLKRGIETLQQTVGGAPELWHVLYRNAWPPQLARGLAGALLAGWLLHVYLRRRPEPWRGAALAIGGLLLLSPTFHPWYVLWILPFAAAELWWGWLVFAAVLPLTYLGGSGVVHGWVLALEYVPLFGWLALAWKRGSRR